MGSDMSLGDRILNAILNFLPRSPFQRFINAMDSIPNLEYLNFFIPVSQIIAIGQAWLTAIAVFYLYQIVLRWIKAIS